MPKRIPRHSKPSTLPIGSHPPFRIGQRVLWGLPGEDKLAAKIIRIKKCVLPATGDTILIYGLDLEGIGSHGPDGRPYASWAELLTPLHYDDNTPTTWAAFKRVCGWRPGEVMRRRHAG